MPGNLLQELKVVRNSGPDFITRTCAFRTQDISGWYPASVFCDKVDAWHVWTCDGRVPYTLSPEEFESLMELLESLRNAG